MFRKVLVANRGEIAVRICRTLDAMDIPSVAVFAHADRDSLHVQAAKEAHALGDGGVADTYASVDCLLAAVERSGADAVHPGYGFLSESAPFAAALERRSVAFIGPRPEHLASFGLKHEARRLAEAAGVALQPGSGVLGNVDEALEAAEAIGYPVMLKSSAGGGGIGMQRCDDAQELGRRFAAVEHLAGTQFGDARLFVERCVTAPRHVEVQAFGDGDGGIAILGDRDCSLQRRHQKLVEECPAPNLPPAVRERMHADARALLASVAYRSAGTVEFLYDSVREEAAFLEVNTRLQVEHGVTELVYGIDLVRWMIELAAGELSPLDALTDDLMPSGTAIEARLCAEDPNHDFRPTPGLLSVVDFPRQAGLRVDTWLRSGTEVPALYDSLIAKAMVHGSDREAARLGLRDALAASVLHGVETNREYLRQTLDSPDFAGAVHDTGSLGRLEYRPPTFDVIAPGAQTTVQAWPGRTGYWSVGVPPSGPMDDVSFRLGNRVLGNDQGAPGIEIAVRGPTLRFNCDATALVAGAARTAVDAVPVEPWRPFPVRRGETLAIGEVVDGVRAYLLVAGGLDVPEVMGSAATFALGRMGGINGRALATGDVLRIAPAEKNPKGRCAAVPPPSLDARHVLRVTLGPHCTEDFLTAADMRAVLAAEWRVHYHSSRTGVRLIGPRPEWARPDGGDAGLHPSNVHDNAYAFGAIDFTGDMPVVLGPDGPSLGGFVCPAAVIPADRWKLGQLGAGESVRLQAVGEVQARQIGREQDASIQAASTVPFVAHRRARVFHKGRAEDAIVARVGDITVRRAAADTLLVEFGPNVLDIALRLRVHALEAAIAAERMRGVLETTAGIRSLLIRFDSGRWSAAALTDWLTPHLEQATAAAARRVPSRIVHLPLSWDDPACREAIDRYVQSVRPDAPWCPDNVEFIRRINGLDDRQAVKRIVFGAEYLVMGLGDVYLGAPVATPVDPRHRLVTTKYNPARTWTAENSVGIGGAYLCIYGMEGPGGYQFVGRTLQVWDTHRRGAAFDKHWLLRPFDRIRFHEVDAKELLDMREAFGRGAHEIDVEEGLFEHDAHRAFLAANAQEIDAFSARRRAAFAAELDDWKARGVLSFEQVQEADGAEATAPDGAGAFVASPLAGAIWAVHVRTGQRVAAGDLLFVVESMKAEFEVVAPTAGTVGEVLVVKGQTVAAGQPLALAA